MKVSTIGFKSFRITLAAGQIPKKLSDVSLQTTEFELYCGSTNTGDMFLGNSTVDSTNWIPRKKDTRTDFEPEDIDGEPKHYDFSTLYLTGTVGDYAIIQYRVKSD